MNKKVTLISKYKQLENPTRYTVCTGGRGSGKSFHVSLKKLFDTYKSGRKILYTRYYLSSAKDSIIPEFIEKIDMAGLNNHFIITKTDIINKITGSRILFRGINTTSGNQTAKLKSINGLTDWVCEEAEEMGNEEEFDDIDNSIRKKDSVNDITIVMNPADKEHWIYKSYFLKGKRKDTTYIHTSYLDNLANLNQTFVDKANWTKEMNPKKYAIVYMGEWAGSEDLVFTEGFTTYTQLPEAHTFDWTYYGGDFGFTDPTTIMEVNKQGYDLYLKLKLYKSGMTNPDIAKAIKELGLVQELTIFDSAEPKSINELMTLGCYNIIGAVKGGDSVHYGIQKIKQFDVHLHESDEEVIHEWANYKWKKNKQTGEYLRNKNGHRIPEDKDNHCIDPTRYVLNYFYY